MVGEDNYFSGCQPLKIGYFLFKALYITPVVYKGFNIEAFNVSGLAKKEKELLFWDVESNESDAYFLQETKIKELAQVNSLENSKY